MESNGWNDSGHNFLACRNGLILVGRHMSLPAIRQDRMVVSAHCPGHNEQPGIEHEHEGDENDDRADERERMASCLDHQPLPYASTTF